MPDVHPAALPLYRNGAPFTIFPLASAGFSPACVCSLRGTMMSFSLYRPCPSPIPATPPKLTRIRKSDPGFLPPSFHHSEVEALYHHSFDLPPSVIAELLELPGASLIADPEAVLHDAREGAYFLSKADSRVGIKRPFSPCTRSSSSGNSPQWIRCRGSMTSSPKKESRPFATAGGLLRLDPRSPQAFRRNRV